jgi:hypothetical protein
VNKGMKKINKYKDLKTLNFKASKAIIEMVIKNHRTYLYETSIFKYYLEELRASKDETWLCELVGVSVGSERQWSTCNASGL